MTEIRLSGAVMAHPRRREAAEGLARLDPAGELRVVLDPEPDGPPTALRTAKLAWSSVPEGATHFLVLQDDVQLADGFFEHARKAAERLPEEAIAFYANWNSRNGAAVRMAAAAGADWATAVNEYAPCVAMMLPAEIARGYAPFSDAHQDGWPCDVLMFRYLQSVGVKIRIAVPNTVEHSGLPSVAGNDAHGLRRSSCFSGVAPSDVGTEIAEHEVIPFHKHVTSECAVRGDGYWDYLGTERLLRRSGISPQECRTEFERGEELSEGAWQTWLTAFAMGLSSVDAVENESLDLALASIGPGGLCDQLTATEIEAITASHNEVAVKGFAAGRDRAGRPRRTRAGSGVQVAITGPGGPLAEHLSGLLAELGHEIVGQEGASASTRLIHLGDETDPGEVFCAIVDTGAREHVLRFATPIGPHTRTDSLVARWVQLAWTRKALPVDPDRVHQFTDVRDMASAVDAVLCGGPVSPVYDIATATLTGNELAKVVCASVRAVPTETVTSSSETPVMKLGLAAAELGWTATIPADESVRNFGKWLAYDVEWVR
ncbi:NAD-dependent epimerase/dehydratase family protein [Amycolatopsis pittospori]|uniref:NAD(P)-dependent oxidoreductase n=1 Tax=Amycolatopsis pittospori TaxID=2749434 RepID=UPI0015F07AE4|nr:NAD(P)-dependent oxidoreductase [Amycolatopsis pittospori]